MAGPGESVVGLAATERAEMGMLILAMGTGRGLGRTVFTHIPNNAQGVVVEHDKATTGAFRPCWFTVGKFDWGGRVLVMEDVMTFLHADKAVGG
jgi:hypothetical protein